MNGIYPDFNNMGWAPVDMKIYHNWPDETYYCMALTWTATALTDAKFKIMRKLSVGWSTDSISHAYSVVLWKMKWWFKYELPATDLAVVQAYTYNIA
jgi:hypothetical protein